MSARAPWPPAGGYVRFDRSRTRRRVVSAASAVLCLSAIGTGLAMIATAQRLAPAVEGGPGWADRLAAAAGLKPERIEVRGHRYTSLSEISAAVALHGIASQLSFDPSAAERRIEALPWIARAQVRRVLPDAVAVEVVERMPAIVWRAAERDMLVDMHGRVLSEIPRGSDTGLPVVIGAGAGPAAPALIELLRQHPEIERRFAEAIRIDDRRWRLLLASGTFVELPGSGTAAALAWLEAHARHGVLDRGLATLDLRVPDQLVVRLVPGTRDARAPSARSTSPAAIAGAGSP